MEIYVISVTPSPTLYARRFSNWQEAGTFMEEMSEGDEINFIVTESMEELERSYGDLQNVDVVLVEAER